MPLIKPRKGASKKTVAAAVRRNFEEMQAAGHPRDQSWAAAYSAAGEKKRPRKKAKTKSKAHAAPKMKTGFY